MKALLVLYMKIVPLCLNLEDNQIISPDETLKAGGSIHCRSDVLIRIETEHK